MFLTIDSNSNNNNKRSSNNNSDRRRRRNSNKRLSKFPAVPDFPLFFVSLDDDAAPFSSSGWSGRGFEFEGFGGREDGPGWRGGGGGCSVKLQSREE